MEGNPKWLVKLALKLELFEIFDALTRCLNLRETYKSNKMMAIWLTDLDCNHANSCNHIQRAPQDAIVE